MGELWALLGWACLPLVSPRARAREWATLVKAAAPINIRVDQVLKCVGPWVLPDGMQDRLGQATTQIGTPKNQV